MTNNPEGTELVRLAIDTGTAEWVEDCCMRAASEGVNDARLIAWHTRIVETYADPLAVLAAASGARAPMPSEHSAVVGDDGEDGLAVALGLRRADAGDVEECGLRRRARGRGS